MTITASAGAFLFALITASNIRFIVSGLICEALFRWREAALYRILDTLVLYRQQSAPADVILLYTTKNSRAIDIFLRCRAMVRPARCNKKPWLIGIYSRNAGFDLLQQHIYRLRDRLPHRLYPISYFKFRVIITDDGWRHRLWWHM